MYKHRKENFQYPYFNRLKSKQESHQIQLRRSKRNSNFAAKRLKLIGTSSVDIPPSIHKIYPHLSPEDMQGILLHIQKILQDPPNAIALEDSFRVLRSCCSNSQTFFSGMADADLISQCLAYCDIKYPTSIIVDATYILSNFASGPHEYTNMVFQLGGVLTMFKIIEAINLNQCDNPLSALANLAADSEQIRESIFELGTIPLLRLKLEDEIENPTRRP